MRPQGPPSSFPSGLQPVVSDPNGRPQIHRRVSRTDLDFEQALLAEGTVVLREGIDVNSLGVESPGPVNRSFSSSSYSTPSSTPVNRSISRVALQPPTPVVVPPSPSPAPAGQFSSSSSGGPNGGGGRLMSSHLISRGHSPSSSSQDLVADAAEEAERQTNRRSMYRSPGTSSSPDLATLLRKAKERGGAMVGGGGGGNGSAGQGVVGALGRKDKRREEHPPLPTHDQTTVRGRPTPPVSYVDWTTTSPKQNKDGTIKASKSSVRAKTSAFLGKMLGQNTVRERSKTDASPSSLMNAFAPPVPPIPLEHRSPHPSDKSSSSAKPLPPIVRSPSTMREGEDFDDRSIVFVDKVSPLPPLPASSPPVTPVRVKTVSSASASGTTRTRRSMSVSDVDVRPAAPPPSTPNNATASASAAASPTSVPRAPLAHRNESAPAHLEENTLVGILDMFKGELSTLDPFAGASLDLRDPSTPPSRQINRRSKTDGVLLPSRERAAEEKTTPTTPKRQTFSDPFGGRPNTATGATTTSTPTTPTQAEDTPMPASPVSPTIIPPRTSSISLRSTARNSVGTGTGIHVAGSRLSLTTTTPSRSRNGPPTSALAAQSLSPRSASSLRALQRSNASSSEPSLVPLPGEGRSLPPSRRSSQQELTSPTDSIQPTTSPTIIAGEDLGDMESRGKDLAARCWDENDDFLPKEKIAEWLGGHGQINRVSLRYYVDNFDFSGLRLDMAFRRLCGKLYLKAETQQVDRILEQFSRRYWDCNPESVFGSASLVHAVSYSLLLLNTDLHIAELATHMSRSQFVRNTMTAIQMQLQPSAVARISNTDLTRDDSSSVRGGGSDETEMMARSKRSDSVTSWNSVTRESLSTLPTTASNTPTLDSHQPNGSNPSVQITNGQDPAIPNRQQGKAWESDMENLLKEMFGAIKNQQILQPLDTNLTRGSTSSLSPGGGGMMRHRSFRGQPDRLNTYKRGSIRGLQSILSVQSGVSPYSSNSSIDGRVSPSPSFATSTHELYGSSSSFFNPTLGFASNLSHTIIREAQEDDDRSVHSEESTSTTISISDEELALLGAPWAKEGMLCRKQYWESANKRAKDKNWMDVFVVIQKGELNMFTFGDHTSGMSGTFGGGNWLANAQPVGTIELAHSLARALPPPGYHKRPHCMVLTLANRAVYFFQAGTEELVNEWVSTCNYWAARTSKEPLAGGVSNMEYGWNRVADLLDGHGRSHSQSDLRNDEIPDTMSIRSGKSTRSKYGWKDGAATVRGMSSPRSDKTYYINGWKPPMPPTVASIHDEEAQLDALRKHVASLKKDLESHNDLREPMLALYQPRSANALKAQTNWEEKSQYLLRESVKYDMYIDSLQAAMALRLKKRGEKALERALNHSSPVDEVDSKKRSGPASIIDEEPEPKTPSARDFPQNTHRREVAEIDDEND